MLAKDIAWDVRDVSFSPLLIPIDEDQTQVRHDSVDGADDEECSENKLAVH